MIKGVPDIVSYTRMARITGDLRARLEAASQESVTGIRHDIPKAAGGRIGEANIVSKALGDIARRGDMYTLVEARIDQMSTVLGSLGEISDGFRAGMLGTLEMPDGMEARTARVEARAALETAFSMLNAGQGGRTLFAGEATRTEPLSGAGQLIADIEVLLAGAGTAAEASAALDTYFNDPAGGFATAIYQGGTGKAAPLPMANGTQLDYTVRADEQAIRDTLRGLAVVAASGSLSLGQPSAEYSTLMESEMATLERGREGLVELEARLGVAHQTIERSREADAGEKLILSAVYQTLVGRDQFEAASEVKQIETQLEASYLVTARLAGLNLTNFLR